MSTSELENQTTTHFYFCYSFLIVDIVVTFQKNKRDNKTLTRNYIITQCIILSNFFQLYNEKAIQSNKVILSTKYLLNIFMEKQHKKDYS